MTTHRFQISSVNELNHEKISAHPSEMIPLINVEKPDVPTPPPLPTSFALINEIHKLPPKLSNSFLQRLKTYSSASDLIEKVESSSLPANHSKTMSNLNKYGIVPEESDSCYSTVHSNTFEKSSPRLGNKFLHELRLKRRELRDKARNISIDDRIAFNRHRYKRDLTRAQDIFDVHFESNDDDNDIQYNTFDENLQEKIRKNIFHELDRQRMKQFHKQHRHLVLGRAFLLLIVSILAFMGITLIYVVIDFYDRANYINRTTSDNEYLSMIYDNGSNI